MQRVSATTTQLQTACQLQYRRIVQTRGRDTTIGGSGDRRVEGMRQLGNAKGAAYRSRQKLWPSVEALERDLTAFFYDPLSRSSVASLPRAAGDVGEATLPPPPSRLDRLRVEGRGVAKMQRQAEVEGESQRQALAMFMDPEEEQWGGVVGAAAGDLSTELIPALEDAPIASKMLVTSSGDLEGSSLASFHPLRDALFEDLERNPSSTAAGAVTWGSISALDPFVAARCSQHLGPTATRAQGRLLSALLDEDHNDVVFNAADGSGKTWALVAAALHGVRAETTGMNILVGSSPMAVKRMRDMVVALSGEFGGSVADREIADMSSWLFHGTNVLDCPHYWSVLKHQATVDPRGAHRLMIVTADVLTELMFQHELEFEEMGYLRRCFVDDAGHQLRTLPLVASKEKIVERLTTPRAVEYALMTLHQMPSPHIRALMQIAAVGSTLDTRSCDYLEKACIKPLRKTVILAPERLPSSVHCTFSFFNPMRMPQAANASYSRVNLFDSYNSSAAGIASVKGQANVGDTLSVTYAGGSGSLPGKRVTDENKGTTVGGLRSNYMKGRVSATGNTVMQSVSETLLALDHMKAFAFNARNVIPGRVLIFVDNDVNLLSARQHLRKQGMDVKVLSEVYRAPSNGDQLQMQSNWKFLLLRETEGLSVEFPFVSHVFITFCPTHRRNYQHMASKATDGVQPGWAVVTCNQKHAPEVRRVVEELDVNFVKHVITENLEAVPVETAESISRRTDLSTPLSNPQLLVELHYRNLTGGQDASAGKSSFEREIFGRGDQYRKEFEKVDYEPFEQKVMRRKNASLLARDIAKDPSLAQDLVRQGLLDGQMKPTSAMWKWMSNTSSHGEMGSSPYLKDGSRK